MLGLGKVLVHTEAEMTNCCLSPLGEPGWKLSTGKIPCSCIKGRLGLQSSAALLSLYGSGPTPDCLLELPMEMETGLAVPLLTDVECAETVEGNHHT